MTRLPKISFRDSRIVIVAWGSAETLFAPARGGSRTQPPQAKANAKPTAAMK